MNDAVELILASASPRRRELIPFLGLPWKILAVDVDEDQIDHPDPAENVMHTAVLKAEEAARRTADKAVILAADTTVVLDGAFLNKPRDEEEARQMLRRLRNRSHQVYSGIAIINKYAGQKVIDVASVDVPVRNYSDQEIEAYIATGDPLDKAGAYAIQHPDFRPVSELTGCYSAVMGLPLCHAARALRKMAFEVAGDVAQKCQAHHGYDCPIFESILQAA